MQALWSRAAQATSSCRCSSCLHSATAIARRTTTTATRRQLTAGELFTACYSTILASAAIVDARVKDAKINEWDRRIAEARAGNLVQEPELEGSTSTRQGSDSLDSKKLLQVKSTFGVIECSNQTYQPLSIWNEAARRAPSLQHAPLASKLRNLDYQLTHSLKSYQGKQNEASNPLLRTSKDDLVAEWIDEELDPQLLPREPKENMHLEKMEIATSKLVDSLLMKINFISGREIAGFSKRSDLCRQMDEMAERIRTLKSGFTQYPTYTWGDSVSVQERRSELHKSLYTLCRSTTSDPANVDLILAKICYNLLICTAPPSITTYNILIAELLRLRQHNTTQEVVDSFLYDTKFKPTKMSMRVILDHYIAKKDRLGFRAISRRMNGTDGDMRIKRRAICALRFREVRKWALANHVNRRGGYLVQHMPRDSKVYDSLICGNLKFNGPRPAIRYVRAAFRDGQQVMEGTLCSVIESCVSRLDYRAGCSLLNAILALWRGIRLPSVIFYTSKVRFHVYQLLNLCGWTASMDAEQILPEYVSRDGLENMLRHMRLESGSDALGRFIKRMEYLEKTIGMRHSSSTSSEVLHTNPSPIVVRDFDPIEEALILLNRQSMADRRHQAKRDASTANNRWTRLQVLEAQLNALDVRLVDTKLKVLDVQLDAQAERHALNQSLLADVIYCRLGKRFQEKYIAKTTSKTKSQTSVADRLHLLLALYQEEQQLAKTREIARLRKAVKANRKRLHWLQGGIKKLLQDLQWETPRAHAEVPKAVPLKNSSPSLTMYGQKRTSRQRQDGSLGPQQLRVDTQPSRSSPSIISLPTLQTRLDYEAAAG